MSLRERIPDHRYPAIQFAIFRIAMGLYLALHFASQISYGPEVYSSSGMLPSASGNLTYPYFPNLLYVFDSPGFVKAFLALLSLASLLFAFGWYRSLMGVLLWYGLACLFNRNCLTSNPGLAFLGWLSLASAIVPAGEPYVIRLSGAPKLSTTKPGWEFPPLLYWGAWLVMGLGYTASGIAKLASPSWVDGTAAYWSAHQILGRDWFLSQWFFAAPKWFIQFSTWGTLAAELLFLPLCFTRLTRLVAWISIFFMHCTLLLLMSFPSLTLGVLLFHLFTFDVNWLPATWIRRIERYNTVQ